MIVQFMVFFTATSIALLQEVDKDDLFNVISFLIALSGVCSSLASAGVFGAASILPQEYTQSLVLGQSVAGLFVSFSSMLTILAHESTYTHGMALVGREVATTMPPVQSDESVRIAAFIYFLIACIVIALCGLSWRAMVRSPFYKYQKRLFNRAPKLTAATPRGSVIADWNVQKEVFWDLYDLAIGVFLVFTVTIAVFPSILTSISSVGLPTSSAKWDLIGRLQGDMFVPVGFVLFNLGDLGGRFIADSASILPDRHILVASVLRIAFIPLFLHCNIVHPSLPNHEGLVLNRLSFYFTEDIYPFVFNALFALSNGYLTARAMMLGPKRVRPEHQEVAGIIMILSLTCGLAAGSILSFAIRAAIM